MNTTKILVLALCVGFAMRLIGIQYSLGLPEILILSSSALLLILCELQGPLRRLAAVERYLQLTLAKKGYAPSDAPADGTVSAYRKTENALRSLLRPIAGERHPKTSRTHHDFVRDLMVSHMKRHGWDVRLDPFAARSGDGKNIIAEKQGANPDAGVLIVGAHYDTVMGTAGADDNGIAVAGLMRLAEQLSPQTHEKTIRLVAWDLEEKQSSGQSLLGSRSMARNLLRKGEKIEGVICLEMIGYCDSRPGSQKSIPGLRFLAPRLWHYLQANCFRGDFVAVVGNSVANHLATTFEHTATTQNLPAFSLTINGLLRFIRDLRRSDHAPFWDAGIPAIMVTDTANFRSPFYHTPMDVFETIDFEFAARIIETTAACIAELAGVIPASEDAEVHPASICSQNH